jgi:trimeric autotransporter adhesin
MMKREILATRTSATWSGRIAVFGLLMAAAFQTAQAGSVFQTVTNTNDSGAGSLRAAIQAANGNGSAGGIIEFAIGSSCGPQVISLKSELPEITTDVLIKGYTQPGASANDLDTGDDAKICIILDGSTHNVANAISANGTSGESLTLEGLAFSGFSATAIDLAGTGHTIEGIRVGGSASGVALDPVGYGIVVDLDGSDVTIGGSDDSNRNIIGDTTEAPIIIAGGSDIPNSAAHNNKIINNYIGVGWNNSTSKFTNLENTQEGVVIEGSSNTIKNNVIGFNFLGGIELFTSDAHNNTVSDNYIGISPLGDNQSNYDGGVRIFEGAHDNEIMGNTIADNEYTGITIDDDSQGNHITGNSIHDNGQLGIDLGGDGVTPNDNDSLEVNQPNRKLNFPIIQSAIGEGFKGTVAGYVFTTPGDYTIEIFASQACDASGYGQGDEFVGTGTATVAANGLLVQGQGSGAFSIPVVGFFVAGYTHITATATDANGNTSEFSQCFDYTDDQIFGNGFEPGLF